MSQYNDMLSHLRLKGSPGTSALQPYFLRTSSKSVSGGGGAARPSSLRLSARDALSEPSGSSSRSATSVSSSTSSSARGTLTGEVREPADLTAREGPSGVTRLTSALWARSRRRRPLLPVEPKLSSLWAEPWLRTEPWDRTDATLAWLRLEAALERLRTEPTLLRLWVDVALGGRGGKPIWWYPGVGIRSTGSSAGGIRASINPVSRVAQSQAFLGNTPGVRHFFPLAAEPRLPLDDLPEDLESCLGGWGDWGRAEVPRISKDSPEPRGVSTPGLSL